MTSDTIAKRGNPPQPLPARQLGAPRRSPRGRWWKRGLLAVGGLAALSASAAALLTGAMSSQQAGPKLTHTITRGDLLVAVTEQGILESAENTEIKCKVRGRNTVTWVIESGTVVQPGDELMRLDTLFMDEQIAERTKYSLSSKSAAEQSKANVATAELAVTEYERGRYVSELLTLERDLAIAESDLSGAQNMLSHAQLMAESGYASELDVEESAFAVTLAELDLDIKKTEIEVLQRFTRKEELQTLKGNLAAEKANHAANVERAMADTSRLARALGEFEHCVVKAEKGGLVIHPSAARWENAPEIAQGTTVHKDQVLLLMPDLAKMQVKVGIHESVIDHMQPGLTARVMLPDKTLDGTVFSVASITRPAGWWTGNEVRYDTIIQLPAVAGLRPGTSAEVEVLIARHEDVLTIPVAAVAETAEGDFFCWVKTAQGTRRRTLALGDSNDVFTVVEAGLKEGDQVVLNPLAFANHRQTPLDRSASAPTPESSPTNLMKP
jgi:HlyD family secretion protein